MLKQSVLFCKTLTEQNLSHCGTILFSILIITTFSSHIFALYMVLDSLVFNSFDSDTFFLKFQFMFDCFHVWLISTTSFENSIHHAAPFWISAFKLSLIKANDMISKWTIGAKQFWLELGFGPQPFPHS